MAKTLTAFDMYEVTNGAVKWAGDEIAEVVELGCTGSLETETELKTVIKKCEGVEVKNVAIPQKMTGTFVGHMPLAVLRKAYGLKTKGLKTGVWSYGMDSRAGQGVFTWDVFNLENDERKLIAFPNGQINTGFKFRIENGADEIAEVEMTINFLRDEKKQFYYEAIENELEDTTIADEWGKNFALDLIYGEDEPTGDAVIGPDALTDESPKDTTRSVNKAQTTKK